MERGRSLPGHARHPAQRARPQPSVAAGEILAGLARDGRAATSLPYVASPLARARLTMELVRDV